MPIDWGAVQSSQHQSFEDALAEQEMKRSLVFKLLQQRQQEAQLAREQEKETYSRQQDTKNFDFKKQGFESDKQARERDDTRQDLALKQADEERTWQRFQATIGMMPSGTTVPPAVYEQAKKYGVDGRLKPTGTGTYVVLPSSKEVADEKRDHDRDVRENRMAAAQGANLAAQTHRMENEDRRVADMEKRTKIMEERQAKIAAEAEKLPPELQAVMKRLIDEDIKAATTTDWSGVGLAGKKPGREDILRFAEKALNEVRGISGPTPGSSQTPASRAAPAKPKFEILDVK